MVWKVNSNRDDRDGELGGRVSALNCCEPNLSVHVACALANFQASELAEKATFTDSNPCDKHEILETSTSRRGMHTSHSR